MPKGSFSIRRLTEYFDEIRDAFGNEISRTTRNNADLASHYQYTPERHRLYKNGTRELIHYDVDGSSDLEDNRAGAEDVFVLTPSAGDTLQFRSAERFRYTVNYVSQVTQAFAVNQSLSNTDDRVTIGLDTSPNIDLSDGYFLEHLPSHSDTEVDLFIKRNGNVVGDRTTVTLQAAVTAWQRFVNEYSWYNVAGSEWSNTISGTFDGENEVRNFKLAEFGVADGDTNAGPGGRGPISGNGHIIYEVEADSSTTGLELFVGSMSFTTLGATPASVKAKGAETDAIDVTQTDDYEPLFALRRDPNRPNVNVDLRQIEITQGAGQALAISCNSSEVLDSNGNELADSGFSRPAEHSIQNSVVEVTNGSYVNQFPNSTGSTVTTASDPGGYQLAFDSTRQAQGGQVERTANLVEKHGIHNQDIAVFLALPDDAATDYRIFYTTELDE